MAAEKPKPQYSFSRLDLYERCPWAYKTVYLDKIPRAGNEARESGQLLHQSGGRLPGSADFSGPVHRLGLGPGRHSPGQPWPTPSRCGSAFIKPSSCLPAWKPPGWRTGWPSTASGALSNSTPKRPTSAWSSIFTSGKTAWVSSWTGRPTGRCPRPWPRTCNSAPMVGV